MKSKAFRSLFFGGILPVIAFALIEDHYGTIAGLIAGMVFGVGEIIWEWRTVGRVDPITWGGNGMILVLGGVSLITQNGIWFKLQPALIEAVMAVLLWASVIAGKPFLLAMARKQGTLPPTMPKPVEAVMVGSLTGLTLRLGVFFMAHAILATWAAVKWSTVAWAWLKGAGFTVSMVLYLVVETLVLRYRVRTGILKNGTHSVAERKNPDVLY